MRMHTRGQRSEASFRRQLEGSLILQLLVAEVQRGLLKPSTYTFIDSHQDADLQGYHHAYLKNSDELFAIQGEWNQMQGNDGEPCQEAAHRRNHQQCSNV